MHCEIHQMPSLPCRLFNVAIVVLIIWMTVGLLALYIIYMCMQIFKGVSGHWHGVLAIFY